MSRLAVYISSFDGYSDLWDTFFTIFDRFWNPCSFPIYLVNNEMSYSHNNATVLNTGLEVCWFDRTLRSLEMIDEGYVLFMLEDYFLSKKINEQDIDEIVDVMNQKRLFCYRLSPHKLRKTRNNYQAVPSNTKYPITLQPAIWRREKLIQILKEINGRTPWDFEYYYDNVDFTDNKSIPGILYDNRDILGYKNGVLRGKWIPDTVKYYKSIGLAIHTDNRGILPQKTYNKYKLVDYLSIIIPNSLRKPIKRIVKKLGIKYV